MTATMILGEKLSILLIIPLIGLDTDCIFNESNTDGRNNKNTKK